MIEKLCFQNYNNNKIVRNESIMYPKRFRHFYSLPIYVAELLVCHAHARLILVAGFKERQKERERERDKKEGIFFL